MPECASELGLNAKTLGNWIATRRHRATGEPDPRAEERELRERIGELEMENAFLKKPRSSLPMTGRKRDVRAHAR